MLFPGNHRTVFPASSSGWWLCIILTLTITPHRIKSNNQDLWGSQDTEVLTRGFWSRKPYSSEMWYLPKDSGVTSFKVCLWDSIFSLEVSICLRWGKWLTRRNVPAVRFWLRPAACCFGGGKEEPCPEVEFQDDHSCSQTTPGKQRRLGIKTHMQTDWL